MADKLLSALRKLDPETLVYVGANAVKQAELCEAAGTGQARLWACVWEAIAVVTDRALLEKTSVPHGQGTGEAAATRTAVSPEGELSPPSTPSGPQSSAVETGPHAGGTQYEQVSRPGIMDGPTR